MIPVRLSKQMPGRYELEFVEERKRKSWYGYAATQELACAAAKEALALSVCVLRIVGTELEVEDESRLSAGTAPGQRFFATVLQGDLIAKLQLVRPLDAHAVR